MEIKTIGDVKVAVMVPRFDSHTAEEVETAGLTQLFTIYDSVGQALKDLEWKDNKTGEKHWKIKSIDPRIAREI